MTGKHNISWGLMFLAVFMLYGFLLIYLRDFAPGKEQWINEYSTGKHFESRLAHVHGNLFAFLNILIGYLLLKFDIPLKTKKVISFLALTGMLMPTGIVLEIYLGAPPYFVLVGAIMEIAAVFLLGFNIFQLKNLKQHV